MVALSGVFQVAMGVLRLGHHIHDVPYPVISDFMSGIGAIVIVLQLAQVWIAVNVLNTGNGEAVWHGLVRGAALPLLRDSC
jgi:MFS superfamily sulfate permease-like transporter